MSEDLDGLGKSQNIRNGRHQHERRHQPRDYPVNTVDSVLHVQPLRCYEQDEAIILIDFTVNVAIPFIVSPATPVTVTLWPTCLPRSTDVLASPSVDAIPSFIIESCGIESFAMVPFAMASSAIDFF